jgi:hypothetical protein
MRKYTLLFLLSLPLLAQVSPQVTDNGRTGPTYNADGTLAPLRTTRDGSVGNQETHGRYQEAVARGNVYTATTIQATVATTNNSPLAANTGVPLVGLFNPANSGKNFVILRAVVCGVSGTPAAQSLFVWNVIAAPAGITVSGTNGVNNLTFSANSAARVFANSAITGSTLATAFRPIGGPTSAVIAADGSACVPEETAGDIIVPPGGFAGIAVGNGAGTTWIVSAAMTWEEVQF